MRIDQLESPVCTPGGVRRGLLRHEMTVPGYIRAVMAIDMKSIMAERGVDCVLDADLIAMGWTKPQLVEHGPAASALVKMPPEGLHGYVNAAERDEQTFTRAERVAAGAAYAIAADLFIAGIWSIASQALAAQALGHRVILSMVL